MDVQAESAVSMERVGRPQIILLAVGTLVLFTDGFDGLSVSFAAPAISAAWHLTNADMGHVFAANLAGLTIGAVVVTPCADLLSRRLVTMGCIACFGLLTLCVPFVHGVGQLVMLRILTGLALGGAMPSVIVAVSEFLPLRLRARLLAVLICGFSIGLAGAGVAASVLIGPYGWQALFWIGGIMPLLLLLPLIAIFLPESPAFLARRGRGTALAAVLARMGGTMTAAPSAAQAGSAPRAFPAAELFHGGMAPVTLAVWATFFCSGSTLYFLGNWLPLLVTGSGYSQKTASLVATVQVLSGMAGSLAVSALLDRLGVLALCLAYAAACLCVVGIGLGVAHLQMLVCCAGLAGFFVVGGQNGLNAFVGGSVYPARFRVTGLGWGLGVTRLAGVLSASLVGAYVVGLHWQPARVFLVFGSPELLAALSLMWLARRSGRAGMPAPG